MNAGEGNVRVNLELFNADGDSLEVRTMDLPRLSNSQINRVFRDDALVTAGYVDVWTNIPHATITCYGSMLDNLTSDPTTVLPHQRRGRSGSKGGRRFPRTASWPLCRRSAGITLIMCFGAGRAVPGQRRPR